MSTKTRYLQLSDTMMMEYSLTDETSSTSYTAANGVLFTKLKDGHYAIFSPLTCEFYRSADGVKKLDTSSILTTNTLQHLAVPTDTTGGNWYTFLDANHEFITASVMNSIDSTAVKAKEYASYCTNPVTPESSNPFVYTTDSVMPRWDSLKLYLVNGYDFSDIFGLLTKIYVKRNDGSYLDLCNFFFTKNTVYDLIKYLAKPIIFGNFVYDRYVEINLMSIYDMSNNDNSLKSLMNINPNSALRLSFSYVDEDNFEISSTEYTIAELGRNTVSNNQVSCTFTKSVTLNGSIPTEHLSSDNLGVYIAQDPSNPYIQFYGTWKNYPLSFDIVQNFNKTIMLYDTSLVKKEDAAYEVSADYQVEINLKKWLAIHEIECTFMNNESVLKTETYSMTQVFTSSENDDEITKFYYRPMIFDEDLANSVTAIAIKYTMRFVNVEDRVQFTKSGALSITDTNKFYAKGTSLGISDVVPYKIYNKIVESKQSVSGKTYSSNKTKYVKVFYNSTDITLNSSDADYSNGTYTLTLSPVAKNYKFVFKNKYADGTSKYFDLANGCYKLYVASDDGNIIVDPTYSTNMNMTLGELEFNISSSILSKLKKIESGNRKMSIVAYNDDNSISSMYDMNFDF